jgi:AbrB family looped-hinge helix DNA binding protein
MPSATLTSKNQLTLPREIRELLKVEPGKRVLFRVLENGEVRVEPETLPISALKGILKSPLARPPTIEEMDDAIATAATERLGRRHARS